MANHEQSAGEVFEAALDLPPDQRSAYLTRVCRESPELRSLVEELLSDYQRMGSFLDEPVVEPVNTTVGHILTAGAKLGRYTVIEPLGSGGMGAVYRARDEKLERVVALKILSPGVLTGEESRRRFRKEALALAKLNHARIAAVYDVGEQDGVDYIVMECVPGQTLAAALRSGPLTIKDATSIVMQIAEALDEAHEHGVIHRDLKPANVMITPKGQVKVLDFGIAKLLAPTSIEATTSIENGVLIGTPVYMSPEQALGRTVDARTDLWSLGIIYYETLAGRTPFQADSNIATLHAIIKDPPAPLHQLRPNAPPLAEKIVSQTLQKDPAARYQAASEMLRDASDLLFGLSAGTPVTEELQSKPRSRVLAVTAIVALVLTIAAGSALYHLRLQRTERSWRNPIADARFQTVTDFDGLEQAAAISRDGHLVAFLSNRDGPMDVWVTQVDSGQFHNLTHGSVRELVNPSIRTLGFSPDGSMVTFWVRKPGGPGGTTIDTWAVSTLGGEPRPYLEGAAEFDWSHDGSKLAYHTPGPGDPLFVTDGGVQPGIAPIFTAPPGLHSHFPLWAPDAAFLYFVQGELPDKLDIWRIRPTGGAPERITSQDGKITYPVLLDRRTLMYLTGDPDGSGSSLYSIDVERRIPHRLTSGTDRYTSLAATPDGHRLVVTQTTPHGTLFRVRIGDSPAPVSAADRIPLTTSSGFSPRLGPDYLLYISATGTGERIWKLANGASTELWRGDGARVFGGPAISPDGQSVAFSVRQNGKALLYVMQADGTKAHILANSLDLQGAPAWSPDGRSIVSAADDHGIPHLFRIPTDGRSPASFVHEYSRDPVWSPDGRLVVYSGPEIGTTFPVKAVTAEASPHPLTPLTLTNGARHLAFLPAGRSLVFLRGEIQHKDLWLIDLDTGAERQLTNLPPDFDVLDFDLSPDGREVVFERLQERSDLVLLDLPRP